MIVGIGHDVVDTRRIEKALARFGERFRRRVFTENELRLADARQAAGKATVADTLAKRFAAKEACFKALGTGLSEGISWRDAEVRVEKSGRPTLLLHGAAKLRLEAITPRGGKPRLHLSLTGEYPYASAYVTIEAV